MLLRLGGATLARRGGAGGLTGTGGAMLAGPGLVGGGGRGVGFLSARAGGGGRFMFVPETPGSFTAGGGGSGGSSGLEAAAGGGGGRGFTAGGGGGLMDGGGGRGFSFVGFGGSGVGGTTGLEARGFESKPDWSTVDDWFLGSAFFASVDP